MAASASRSSSTPWRFTTIGSSTSRTIERKKTRFGNGPGSEDYAAVGEPGTPRRLPVGALDCHRVPPRLDLDVGLAVKVRRADGETGVTSRRSPPLPALPASAHARTGSKGETDRSHYGRLSSQLLDVVEEAEHALLEQRRGAFVVVGQAVSANRCRSPGYTKSSALSTVSSSWRATSTSPHSSASIMCIWSGTPCGQGRPNSEVGTQL
jgi:hypothetical protein